MKTPGLLLALLGVPLTAAAQDADLQQAALIESAEVQRIRALSLSRKA